MADVDFNGTLTLKFYLSCPDKRRIFYYNCVYWHYFYILYEKNIKAIEKLHNDILIFQFSGSDVQVILCIQFLVTATGLDPTTTYFLNEHLTI